MNKNKQNALNKVSEILNSHKNKFGKNVEYIQINSLYTNTYNVKADIEIWKKIEDEQGLVYAGGFHIYDGETYEQATKTFIEHY